MVTERQFQPFAKTPEYNGEAAMYVGQAVFISHNSSPAVRLERKLYT